MNFLNFFQHLLPDGRAWRITIDKRLRQLFAGLTVIPEGVKAAADSVWADVLPASTSKLDEWERQFGLPGNITVEADRRDRLTATWASLIGGQSPRYIQDTLQGAGFDVYVYEWWQEGTDPTPGTPGTPIAREPAKIIRGTNPRRYTATCGSPEATCGSPEATCGAFYYAAGYWLKNPRYFSGNRYTATCGSPEATCGSPEATCGAFSEYEAYSELVETPVGGREYMLYICGQGGFMSTGTVNSERRLEFEALIMKIAPTQQWVGVNVTYT